MQKLKFSNLNTKINPTLSFKKSKTKSKDLKDEKGQKLPQRSLRDEIQGSLGEF